MKLGTKVTAVVLAVASGLITLGSETIVDFLGKWEGRRYVVYADTLAGGLPTVCKGITHWTSPYPVVLGERWSKEKCKEVETLVITKTQLRLAQCLTNPRITQNVFDALTSHAHNFGVERTCASTSVARINAGDIRGGCDALAYKANGKPNWSHAGGVFVQGLFNRRKAERELCLTNLP